MMPVMDMERQQSTPLASALTLAFALALVIAALLALASVPMLATWLIYDREAITQGQWWRLFTASLPHLSLGHALANGVAWWVLLLALPAPVATSSWRRWAHGMAVTLWLGALSNLGVWLGFAEVARSRGLSGALHGLAVYGLLALWLASWRASRPMSASANLSQAKPLLAQAPCVQVPRWQARCLSHRLSFWLWGYCLLLLAAKLLHEVAWQHPMQRVSWWSFEVNTAAHLCGAVAGALWFALLWAWRAWGLISQPNRRR